MKAAFLPAGRFSLSRGDDAIEASRIALLEQIRVTGSITKAGKAVGISYRTAWLAVDQLNSLAEGNLVERAKGGAGGGGTRLTAEGEKLVKVYRALEAEHSAYMQRLGEGAADFDRFQRLSRKLSLKTSARNQFFGTVESIRPDGLDATVTLSLPGKDKFISRVTRAGLDSLGLAKGQEAYALIKANWIELAAQARPTAGVNVLAGSIRAVTREGGKAEVQVELSGGTLLVARVPDPVSKGAKGAAWEPGRAVVARFRCEDVILGVAR